MNGENTYFILNKNTDYSGGFMEHISLNNGCVCLDADCFNGYLFSPVLDSGESATVWGRVTLDARFGKDSYFSMGIYTVDSEFEKNNCQSIIHSEKYNLSEKLQLLEKYLVQAVSNTTDLLINNAKGRYLFFRLDFFAQAEDRPFVSSVKITFPYVSIVRYLPEIYQDNEFLKGFMGIFSSMYFDLEDDISKITSYLDFDSANHDVLIWIAQMLGIKEAEIWREEQLRRLVGSAVNLYRKKGTVEGLRRLVEIITQTTPYIVESHALRKYRHNKQTHSVLDRLYGNDPYGITVLIEENAVSNQKEFRALDRLMGFFVPANIRHTLVQMKNMVLLNNYTYLGINTYINGYDDMVIDESVQLSFVRIGK